MLSAWEHRDGHAWKDMYFAHIEAEGLRYEWTTWEEGGSDVKTKGKHPQHMKPPKMNISGALQFVASFGYMVHWFPYGKKKWSIEKLLIAETIGSDFINIYGSKMELSGHQVTDLFQC